VGGWREGAETPPAGTPYRYGAEAERRGGKRKEGMEEDGEREGGGDGGVSWGGWAANAAKAATFARPVCAVGPLPGTHIASLSCASCLIAVGSFRGPTRR
jgi:hypothetical protein